jgi:DNA-binding MarR family transcriptional regulator
LSAKNPRDNSKYPGEVPVTDAFSAWVLLDYTRFAIGRLRDMELAQLGLTPEQAAILNILSKYGNSTIGEIADRWMRQHHSVSTLINRMAAQGMVQKTKYPKQKEIEICITEKGKGLYSKVTHNSIDMVFSALSQDDLQKLSQNLKLLYIRSRGLLGTDGTPPFLL